jgi:hypothetical protein
MNLLLARLGLLLFRIIETFSRAPLSVRIRGVSGFLLDSCGRPLDASDDTFSGALLIPNWLRLWAVEVRHAQEGGYGGILSAHCVIFCCKQSWFRDMTTARLSENTRDATATRTQADFLARIRSFLTLTGSSCNHNVSTSLSQRAAVPKLL